MIKNKLDYKLINIAIITLIIYLMYQTGNLWIGVFNKCVNILIPFFFAFIIAYALHPGVKYLQNKNVPKGIAIFLVVAFLFLILGILVVLVVPLLELRTITRFPWIYF